MMVLKEGFTIFCPTSHLYLPGRQDHQGQKRSNYNLVICYQNFHFISFHRTKSKPERATISLRSL